MLKFCLKRLAFLPLVMFGVTFLLFFCLQFLTPEMRAHSAVKVLPAVFAKLGGGEVAAYDNIAKLSVVGVGMRTHAGVAAALFTALAEKGINIELIATSEIKITVAIARDRAEEAQRTAHAVFKLEAQP